jgi:polysaccharide biosynthesis transport protein
MVVDQPRSSFAEAIRYIQNSMQASGLALGAMPKTFLVTSSLAHEGKSVFAVSLARSFARSRRKVLLIDCDFHKPSLWRLMGASGGISLSRVLSNEAHWTDAIHKDPKSAVDFIGIDPANAEPQYGVFSLAMNNLIQQCRAAYDIVIIDSAPVTAVSDALILSRWVDATILAVRWGVTPREIAKTSINKLFQSGARLCGAVLMQVDMRRGVFSPAEFEYYHKQNQHYYGKSA